MNVPPAGSKLSLFGLLRAFNTCSLRENRQCHLAFFMVHQFNNKGNRTRWGDMGHRARQQAAESSRTGSSIRRQRKNDQKMARSSRTKRLHCSHKSALRNDFVSQTFKEICLCQPCPVRQFCSDRRDWPCGHPCPIQ